MAFTTTTGSGGTSLIGTSGVDTASLTTTSLTQGVFIGAQGDADVVNVGGTSSASAYQVFAGAGNDIVNFSAALTGSTVQGNDGNDSLTFAAVTNSVISGLAGNDTVTLGGVVTGSTVNGNDGDDTITLNAGANISLSTVAGGQGNDLITTGAIAIVGRINGQEGNDTITLGNLSAAMSGSTVNGGNGSDVISAANINNGAGAVGAILSGDQGNDNLTGGGGRDTIFGGNGTDIFVGSQMADTLTGGEGVDTFRIIAEDNGGITGTIASGASIGTAGIIANSQQVSSSIGFDVITDFQAGSGGDLLDVLGAAGAITIASSATVLAVSTNYALSGTYTASTGTFVPSTSTTGGADTLIFTSAAGSPAIATTTIGYVLQGVNASQIVASNII